jgi:hydrogenase maturation factor
MCLAFIFKVDKYDKKTKKAIVSLKDIHKEVINPYKLDIKKGDLVKIQMGVILEVVDETSY